MMLSHEEAQQSLEVIERTLAQTRRALAYGGAPYYLLLWGAIWLVGFLVEQFATPKVSGWTWLGLDVFGGALSFWIGYRQSLRVRSRTLGANIGLFWLALIGYGSLWLWLASPTSGAQVSLMITLFAMFGYVVMGLWLRDRGPTWLGLGISGLSLAAYLIVPQWFFLVMGLLGGGTLILSGWWMLARWRD